MRSQKRFNGPTMRISILGGGITGLTTGLLFALGGHQVEIQAAKHLAGRLDHDYDPNFASLHPAASTHAQLCDYREEWLANSLRIFDALTRIAPLAVHPTEHWDLFEVLPEDARGARCEETRFQSPAGGPVWGISSEGQIADMPEYAAWLLGQFIAQSGSVVHGTVESLETAVSEAAADLVINCTGLGARLLTGDAHLEPVGGQLLRVKYDLAVPRERVLGHSYHYYPAPEHYPFTLYCYPRRERLILGGSRIAIDNPDASPPPLRELENYEAIFSLNNHILRQLYEVELNTATYAYTIGLRPYRHGGPRIEQEVIAGRSVIHNYGHGGAGVSLSWGCALEVARVVGIGLATEDVLGLLTRSG